MKHALWQKTKVMWVRTKPDAMQCMKPIALLHERELFLIGGPDGPWHAVTVQVGTPSQSIYLFPGGFWQSNFLSSTICRLIVVTLINTISAGFDSIAFYIICIPTFFRPFSPSPFASSIRFLASLNASLDI
jgi:hypothetical protein